MFDARRAWHIGDVLSIVTGYDASPRGPDAAYRLQDYMANRVLSAQEHTMFASDFKRAVLDQYPELLEYAHDWPVPLELVPEWLRRRAAEFGEYLPVDRLPAGHPVRRGE